MKDQDCSSVFFPVQSSPVPVFFRSWDRTFKLYLWPTGSSTYPNWVAIRSNDCILNIRALLGNISLVNEINFVINPIWVKGGVMSAGAISSVLSFGVNNSHSPHQDFYQDPDEYIFDPDPGTKNNDFNLWSLRAICPLFHILRILHSFSVVGSPNRLPITYLPDVDMAVNTVPV